MVIARSADAVTVVVVDAVLLPGTGSLVVLDTVALFVTDPACGGAVTTTVMVGAVAPAASVGRVQVTETLPVLVHVHPVPVADTKVTPTGSESRTETVVASDGPLFAATSEYVTDPAAVTVAGPVLVMTRSADAVTVVVALEVLLPGIGSVVADETVAMSVSEAA